MQVLVLSSEKKDKPSLRRRRMIIKGLTGLKTNLLNPSPGRPPKDKKVSPALFPQLFFKHQQELLPKADLVIADLTDPDYKIGFLVSQALEKDVPVLGLFWQKLGELEDTTADENFFARSFDQENVRSVLRHFLRSLKTKRSKRGKFFVLEGIGGCGKSTQFKLLKEYLEKNKILYKKIKFPRYKSSFHGRTVRRYLNGEFGQAQEISPYLSSLPYALDRLMAKKEMVDWLRGGCLLVADRYTGSNMAYQSAQFENEDKKKFVNWLAEMEYNVHLLPKEDLVIYLDIPAEKALKLQDKRNSNDKDILEENVNFFKRIVKSYQWVTDYFDHWEKIDCVDKKGNLLSKQEIHQKIINLLKEKEII